MNTRLHTGLIVALVALLWLLNGAVAWADLLEDGFSWAQ